MALVMRAASPRRGGPPKRPKISTGTLREKLDLHVHHRRWVVAGRYSTWNSAQVAATNMRRGNIRMPEGQWRIVAKRLHGGKGIVYVRHVGP